MKEWYDRVKAKEGEKPMYIVAKQWERYKGDREAQSNKKWGGTSVNKKRRGCKKQMGKFWRIFNDRALERGSKGCNAIMRAEKDNYRRYQENHSKNGKWQSDSTIIRDKWENGT